MSNDDDASYEATLRKELAAIEAKKQATKEGEVSPEHLVELGRLQAERENLQAQVESLKNQQAEAQKTIPEPDEYVFVLEKEDKITKPSKNDDDEELEDGVFRFSS